MDRVKALTWGGGLLLSILVWLAIFAGVRSCHGPSDLRPTNPPSRPREATQVATASAAVSAVSTNNVRITVKKARPDAGKAMRSDGGPERIATPLSSSSVELDDGSDAVVIEVSTTTTAQATTSAQAESSARETQPESAQPDHGRLGVLIGTMPGVFAASFQLGSVVIPPSVVGMPIEVGADIELNHEHAGVALTAGGKGFVAGVAWSRWDLRAQGLGIGVGLRF